MNSIIILQLTLHPKENVSILDVTQNIIVVGGIQDSVEESDATANSTPTLIRHP